MDTSKRNRYAGKHSSYDEKGMSDESIKKKLAYDKKYHQTTARKKYRADLNKTNRDLGTYANGDNQDVSHKKNGKKVLEHRSRNRGRNGANGMSTKK